MINPIYLTKKRWIEFSTMDSDALPTRSPSASRNAPLRSEEHTSELQSRPHISYAVFCLKKKKKTHKNSMYFRFKLTS